jgi:uncharacterized membrane protein
LKTSPAWPTSNRLRQIERFAFEEIHIVPEELDRKRGRSSQGTYAFSGVLNMLKWDAGSVKACIPVFVRLSLTAVGLSLHQLHAVFLRDGPASYHRLRLYLGRSIVLGLELLVAADIINSVAINPSFASVGVLGLIVLVRTFLSWALEVEINGEWPWQRLRFHRNEPPDPNQL